MAKENKSAIFRDENGNPHRFYMYPCDLEEEIRNNIEVGVEIIYRTRTAQITRVPPVTGSQPDRQMVGIIDDS